MKIDRKSTDSPEAIARVQPPALRRAPSGPETAGARQDRVEISEAGRRANRELEAAVGPQVVPVSADAPDRIDQIKARVKAGFYVEEQVLVYVAREIVIRGEHRF